MIFQDDVIIGKMNDVAHDLHYDLEELAENLTEAIYSVRCPDMFDDEVESLEFRGAEYEEMAWQSLARVDEHLSKLMILRIELAKAIC